MVRLWIALATTVGAVFLASDARATASCEIAGRGEAGVVLRAEPRAIAKVVRHVPNGAIVSLFDDAASRAHKGWSRIAYAAKGGAAWGAGDRGWVESRYLKDCG